MRAPALSQAPARWEMIALLLLSERGEEPQPKWACPVLGEVGGQNSPSVWDVLQGDRGLVSEEVAQGSVKGQERIWESAGLQGTPQRPREVQAGPGVCRENSGDYLVLWSPGFLLSKTAALKQAWT